MHRRGWFMSAGILIACARLATADSYAPYRDHIQVEPAGRFYVVVNVLPGGPRDPGRGVPVEVSIAERRSGSPPVVAARATPDDEASPEENDSQIKVREGDILHGRVRLERVPAEIIISSTGLGFIGLDVFGYNYAWPDRRHRTNDAVVYVTSDGNVKFRKDTLDLFSDDEMSQFGSTAGGVWWCDGGWFDERDKQFVIVGSRMKAKPKERFFRVLNLETGELSQGSAALAVMALKTDNRGAMEFALDLVAELELKDAHSDLVRILRTSALPSVRKRAAVALAALDDFQGVSVLKDCALQFGDDYSVTHLPMVLGSKAAPVIHDVIKRHAARAENAAWRALTSLGADAVPTLIEMLQSADDPEGQYVAAEAVWSIGPVAKETVPPLIAILEGHTVRDDDQWRVLGMAAGALESIGREAKSAVPALIKFRDAAKAHLDDVTGGQPEKADDAFRIDPVSWRAKHSYKHAVEALKKLMD